MSLDLSFHKVEEHEVYSRNITHNLNKMAVEAGIYECLWHPTDNGFNKAGDMIPLLRVALLDLYSEPNKYIKHNPENGWGDYHGFVSFVEDVLRAAGQHPDARVSACI